MLYIPLMIPRDIAPRLEKAAQTWPSITLTGPRQSGKTTLCRELFPHLPYRSLEAPDVRVLCQPKTRVRSWRNFPTAR